jgi:hypothetical protein
MELKCVPGQESTLLRRNLTSSRDAVVVPTLLGKQMQLPKTTMIMWVQSGSSFWMHFAYHHGVADFLPFMARDVMVVDKEEAISARTHFVLGEDPMPMPWHSHLSSLA